MTTCPHPSAVATYARDMAALMFGCSVEAIVSGQRIKHVVYARKAIVRALSDHTATTRREMANLLCKDVSSISHLAHYRVRDAEPRYRAKMQKLCDAIAAFAAGGRSAPAEFWTEAKDQALRVMWASPDMTDTQIAAALGCSPGDVPARAQALGIMTDAFPIFAGGTAA